MKQAKAAYWAIIITDVIAAVIGLIAAAVFGGALAFFLLLVVVIAILPLTIWIARIVRAFFMLYANMSVNLHEINMKIK